MDRHSRPKRWLLGFVLWFVGLAIFFSVIPIIDEWPILYALYVAFVIDVFFALVIHFPFLRENVGGFPRYMLGLLLWFVIIAIGLRAFFSFEGHILLGSLISAVVIDTIFAVGIRLVTGADRVRERRASRRQQYSSDSDFVSAANYTPNYSEADSGPSTGKVLLNWLGLKVADSLDDMISGGTSQSGPYYQGTDWEQQERESMMAEQYLRDKAYNDAMAAKKAGNNEAAQRNYNEYLKHK